MLREHADTLVTISGRGGATISGWPTGGRGRREQRGLPVVRRFLTVGRSGVPAGSRVVGRASRAASDGNAGGQVERPSSLRVPPTARPTSRKKRASFALIPGQSNLDRPPSGLLGGAAAGARETDPRPGAVLALRKLHQRIRRATLVEPALRTLASTPVARRRRATAMGGRPRPPYRAGDRARAGLGRGPWLCWPGQSGNCRPERDWRGAPAR